MPAGEGGTRSISTGTSTRRSTGTSLTTACRPPRDTAAGAPPPTRPPQPIPARAEMHPPAVASVRPPQRYSLCATSDRVSSARDGAPADCMHGLEDLPRRQTEGKRDRSRPGTCIRCEAIDGATAVQVSQRGAAAWPIPAASLPSDADMARPGSVGFISQSGSSVQLLNPHGLAQRAGV